MKLKKVFFPFAFISSAISGVAGRGFYLNTNAINGFDSDIQSSFVSLLNEIRGYQEGVNLCFRDGKTEFITKNSTYASKLQFKNMAPFLFPQWWSGNASDPSSDYLSFGIVAQKGFDCEYQCDPAVLEDIRNLYDESSALYNVSAPHDVINTMGCNGTNSANQYTELECTIAYGSEDSVWKNCSILCAGSQEKCEVENFKVSSLENKGCGYLPGEFEENANHTDNHIGKKSHVHHEELDHKIVDPVEAPSSNLSVSEAFGVAVGSVFAAVVSAVGIGCAAKKCKSEEKKVSSDPLLLPEVRTASI